MFTPMRTALWLLVFSLLRLTADAAAPAGPNTTVRLLLPVTEVRPGETFLAGLELTMKPGWHTYWENGGDSGKGTSVDWQLPPGVTVGDFRWPLPEKYSDADLVTYVYHGTIMLLIPVTVAADAPAGAATLSGRVNWLECEKLCLPGSGSVQASFTIGPNSRPGPLAPLIRLAESRLPPILADGLATAVWDGPPSLEERPLLLHWKSPPTNGVPDFYPHTGPAIISTATTRSPHPDGGVLLRKKVTRSGDAWPTTISGVFLAATEDGRPLSGATATLAVAEGSANGAATGEPPSGGSVVIDKTSPLSLGRALLLGLLGGLILNIMPCVLPVIALKILGFVRQSGNRPAEIRRLGLVYGAGVWVSFLILAGAVIAVKQAVGIASWGMQFGNPIFLVSLTTLVLLVSLSLFGVFEINLTGRALDRAGELTTREGPAGAFFNGVLAVALATPCTAPFLAPALGYAFTADAPTILAVFSAVAIGLAAPYVLLSFQPWMLKFLPKPGKWMEQFKVAMGFPMLGTALWLYTLAAGRYGDEGFFALGLFLVGVALAAWIWGEFGQRNPRRATVAAIAALALVAALYGLVLERELQWRSPRARAEQTSSAPASADRIAWVVWSREAVDAARRAGKPVLVDFTAQWCLTCQFNERTAIDVPAVRERLHALDYVTFKGDYTDIPPVITEELKRFGRAGVPLVLVYPANPSKEPEVLPELLTQAIMLDALQRGVSGSSDGPGAAR